MNNLNIYNKVAGLVKDYGTRDPFTLARKLNVVVYYSQALQSALGMFTQQNRIKFIFINDNLDINIKKLVLAHELGHALLHAKLLKNDLFLPDNLNLKSKFISQSEHEANFFAAALLIDFRDLERALPYYSDLGSLARHFSVAPELLLYALEESALNDNSPIDKDRLHAFSKDTIFWKNLI